MASKIIITDAGRTELINAQQTGTNAVTLTEVALGTGQYTATASQTTLQSEFKRLTAIAGGAIDNDLIHFTVLDDSTDAYSVFELGVMTDKGTLFAVYSQTTPIVQKAGPSQAMLAIDIKLEDLDATNVVIGDTNFTLAPATERQQGLVELATIDEVMDGVDGVRAVTPLGVNARVGIVEDFVNNEVLATINDINARITNDTLTPFCINQGPLDTNGVPSILSFENKNLGTSEVAFVQPTLTANGTMGGDSFAVYSNPSSSNTYLAFGSGTEFSFSDQNVPSESSPQVLVIYNPEPIKLSSISLRNASVTSRIWKRMLLKGSTDGNSWVNFGDIQNTNLNNQQSVTVTVNATVAYKYFRLEFVAVNGTQYGVLLKDVTLNGTISKSIEGGIIKFKGPLVATTATGEKFTVGQIANLDVSAAKVSTVYIYLDRAGTPTFTMSELHVGPQEPTTAVPGEIWFQTVEPLATYLRLVDQWYEIYLVPVGEAYLDGTGRITAVSTYPYNQNGYTVNSGTVATASTFGLMRVASPEDETNCTCNDASVTPSNFMKMGDYRLAETEYQEGDQVECLYHADLYLVCTTSGMTSAEALDTRTIEVDQSITDGTVTWVVRKRSVSFDVGDVRERDTAKPTYGLV